MKTITILNNRLPEEYGLINSFVLLEENNRHFCILSKGEKTEAGDNKIYIAEAIETTPGVYDLTGIDDSIWGKVINGMQLIVESRTAKEIEKQVSITYNNISINKFVLKGLRPIAVKEESIEKLDGNKFSIEVAINEIVATQDSAPEIAPAVQPSFVQPNFEGQTPLENDVQLSNAGSIKDIETTKSSAMNIEEPPYVPVGNVDDAGQPLVNPFGVYAQPVEETANLNQQVSTGEPDGINEDLFQMPSAAPSQESSITSDLTVTPEVAPVNSGEEPYSQSMYNEPVNIPSGSIESPKNNTDLFELTQRAQELSNELQKIIAELTVICENDKRAKENALQGAEQALNDASQFGSVGQETPGSVNGKLAM